MPVLASPRRIFDGRALMRQRRARGLTRDKLAFLADIPTSTLAKWERSERNPRADSLGLLSAALDCPIDDLFRTIR